MSREVFASGTASLGGADDSGISEPFRLEPLRARILITLAIENLHSPRWSPGVRRRHALLVDEHFAADRAQRTLFPLLKSEGVKAIFWSRRRRRSRSRGIWDPVRRAGVGFDRDKRWEWPWPAAGGLVGIPTCRLFRVSTMFCRWAMREGRPISWPEVNAAGLRSPMGRGWLDERSVGLRIAGDGLPFFDVNFGHGGRTQAYAATPQAGILASCPQRVLWW